MVPPGGWGMRDGGWDHIPSPIPYRLSLSSRLYSTLPFSAPVGQTPTQLPQNTHEVSGISSSKKVATWLSMPRPPHVSAKVYCTSSAQTWMQRQHITHCA